MNTTEPPTSEPESSAPPPTQPLAPRRLTRSSDAKIGGVASGIAQYFGIDPTIVRLLFAASIFLGGFGLICYLIAWVVLPADDGSNVASAPHTVASTSSSIVAVGLLVAGAIVAAATIDNPFGGGFVVPLLLVAAGAFLLMQQPDRPAPPPGGLTTPVPPPPSSTSAALAVRAPDSVVAPPSAPVEPAPPGPPVTALVFSSMALVVAGAFLAEAVDLFEVSPIGVVAICLAVIGVGLIVAALVGGGGGLIPMGVFVTGILLLTSIAAPAFDDGVGERDFEPTSFDAVRDQYRHGIGEMRVDLRAVEFPDGEHHIGVYLGIGEMRVMVPDDVAVEVVGELDIGEVDVFGEIDNGIGNDLEGVRLVDSDATIVLDVDAGVGHVVVEAAR